MSSTIVTTVMEEQVLFHLHEILKIMDKAKPDHGTMFLVVSENYYSVASEDGKINFSLHLAGDENDNTFVCRRVEGGYDFRDADMQDVGEYVREARWKRIEDGLNRDRKARGLTGKIKLCVNDDNGRARAKRTYVKSKPRKDGRMVMITTGEMAMD